MWCLDESEICRFQFNYLLFSRYGNLIKLEKILKILRISSLIPQFSFSKMVLESIHNRIDPSTPVKTTKVRNKQRVISESTGLVKFNLSSDNKPTSKVQEKVQKFSKLNEEFQQLERNLVKVDFSRDHILKSKKSINHGLNLYSPKRAPEKVHERAPVRSPIKIKAPETSKPDEILTQLASKQRQVLDYKTQIEVLKEKSKQSERELHELEKKCGTAIGQPEENPFISPIHQLRKNIETSTSIHQQNFNNLKKKLSLAQLPTSTESFNSLRKNKSSMNLNDNFNKFQNDTKLLINKSLKFVNNLSKELQDKMNKDKYVIYEEDSDEDDFQPINLNKRIKTRNIYDYYEEEEEEEFHDWSYCEADASDFMIAVK